MNREGWLTELAKELEPVIRKGAGLKPRPYRIACGWPSRRGTGQKNRSIGECWCASDDVAAGYREIFISPTLDHPIEVAETTAHELLHAFLKKDVGHRKEFSQAARKIGLEGKPTATYAGEKLGALLVAITDKLGPYPHEKIDPGGPREKGRNLKFMCVGCGYIGRSSAFHLDGAGAPICPTCRNQMLTEDELNGAQPLVMLSQITEFGIPDQFRFTIMRTSTEKSGNWYLLDYDAEGVGNTSARHTRVHSRQDALDLMDGFLTGLTTYEAIEAQAMHDDIKADIDEFLSEDEDEFADYPEDQDPDEPTDERRQEALKLLRAAA